MSTGALGTGLSQQESFKVGAQKLATMADASSSEQNLSKDMESTLELNTPDVSEKPKHLGEKDTQEFPEGGWGWMVVLGGFLVLNTTYGMINAFGVYQVYYMATFPDVKPSILSLIGALQPTVIYLAAIPVIFLTNTFGPNWTIAIGGLIMCFALMMISICKEVWQLFLAQGVVFGLGAGIAFFTAMAVPQEWFKRKRALAIGIIASGSSLGGVIWPIAFQRLVNEVGFPWANRIIGFIYFPMLMAAALTMRSRLPPRKQQVMPNWAVLKDYRLVLLCIGGSLGFFGLFPPLQYIETFAIRLPASSNISTYILAILNALSIVGRIAPAYLADKWGRLNVLTMAVLISGILPLVLWLPAVGARSESLLLAFTILWGVASGSFISLLPSSVGQLFGVQDLYSRLTVTFLSAVPGTLAGSSIAGTFIPGEANDLEGFSKLIIFSGLLMLGGGMVFAILRLTYSTKLFVFI
jgi:MFS family permease